MSYIYNLSLRFEQIVLSAPDSVALKTRTGSDVSFSELDRLANQTANWLSAEGLTAGDVVGIFHDKSAAAYALMLASLKSGIIYANLDPDSPWERLRKILSTCNPKLVTYFGLESRHAASLQSYGYSVRQMECQEVRRSIRSCGDTWTVDPSNVHGDSPAYIMFTSGSTGMPKGAVMSHSNLLNFIDWARQAFDICAADLLSNANPMYFDNSVFDFYASLFNGASLLPITAEEVRDPRGLVNIISDAGCTVWFSVPSLLVYLLTTRALKASDFRSVRKFIFGGEGFPKPKLRELFNLFGDRAELENVYGPTECTCICSSHRVSESDFDDMQSLAPLGYLAPNFAYEIIPHDAGDPEFGELFLRGPQVGLGYLNDPKRTAQAFVQNPINEQYRDIGYRTGDLVRRDETGRLHFKGRSDFQIKHMGYRIELEEIEAALATVVGIRECAVVYRQVAAGMGEIIGFAAVSDNYNSENGLVAAVANIVPSYMVPRRIEIMPNLPKNANGKIDRIQLQQQAG